LSPRQPKLRGGAATDPDAIVAFCRERLANWQGTARRAFRTAAQLPRTPTGKIYKPSLAEVTSFTYTEGIRWFAETCPNTSTPARASRPRARAAHGRPCRGCEAVR
jgi:hypothetical protein